MLVHVNHRTANDYTIVSKFLLNLIAYSEV